MNMTLSFAPLVSLIAGILIVVVPRLLNYYRRNIFDYYRLGRAVRRQRFSYSVVTGHQSAGKDAGTTAGLRFLKLMLYNLAIHSAGFQLARSSRY